MSLLAIEFRATSTRMSVSGASLSLARPSDLERLWLASRDVRAYVVRESDLFRVTASVRESFTVRTKHPAKSLAGYVTRVSKSTYLTIQGKYRSSGQLKRSVKSAVTSLARTGGSCAFFVTTSTILFDSLYDEFSKESAKSSETAKIDPFDATTTTDPYASLVHLAWRDDVPEELVHRYIGNSIEIQAVRRLIMRAAQHTKPVLIQGETGTGKEIVARSIHAYSARSGRSGPIHAINCSAIPSELLESELFGHKRGAFTGAITDRTGLWKAADNGTLFLDEVGELTLPHQAKIVRALQEKVIRPVGSNVEVPVNARVIAATHRDLFAMVKRGRFREDLFYRLRVFLIRTPALREHPEDIPLLAEHLWRGIEDGRGKKRLSKEVLDRLKHYSWPGNARELESTLDNLNAWFDEEVIKVEHLDVVMRFLGQASRQSPDATSEDPVDAYRIECLRHLRRADEVIQAIRVSIRQFLKSSQQAKKLARTLREDLLERHAELDKLSTRSNMFYSPATYEAVNHFKGKLFYFLDALDLKSAKAFAHCEKEIAPLFAKLTRTILDEIHALLRDYDTSRRHGSLKWSIPDTADDL